MDTQYVVPVYYKLRVTPPDQVEPVDGVYERENINASRLFLMTLLGIITPYVDGFLTSGIELLNGKGEETHLHYHLHFRSKTKKEAIRKQLKRKLQDVGVTLLGNKMFSLVVDTYVVEEKFFRYPLKQGLLISYREQRLHIGFDDDTLKAMSERANDSWKISCEVANSRADRREDADSLYLRMLAKYKITGLTNQEDYEICEFLILFYQSENRAVNLTTIKSYVNNIKLDIGQITASQMARLAYGV